MSSEYQDAISKHDDLNRFIANQDVFMSTSFDDFVIPDEGFREWITPKYIESYKQCSANAYNNKVIWKLTRLASLKSACTAEGTRQCDKMLGAIAKDHLSKINEYYIAIMGDKMNLADESSTLFTAPWTNTMNKLAGEFEKIKEEYAQMGYDLALHFKSRSRDSNYYQILKGIKNVECSFDLKSKIIPKAAELQQIEDKLDKDNTGVPIWGIIVGIVIAIRIILLIARISR